MRPVSSRFRDDAIQIAFNMATHTVMDEETKAALKIAETQGYPTFDGLAQAQEATPVTRYGLISFFFSLCGWPYDRHD
jgi:hypothetical protein